MVNLGLIEIRSWSSGVSYKFLLLIPTVHLPSRYCSLIHVLVLTSILLVSFRENRCRCRPFIILKIGCEIGGDAHRHPHLGNLNIFSLSNNTTPKLLPRKYHLRQSKKSIILSAGTSPLYLITRSCTPVNGHNSCCYYKRKLLNISL